MRIIFMGTPKFAADILSLLAESMDVRAVFTAPDKVRGRGSKLESSPVKAEAERLGIEVFCPTTLKDPDVVATIGSLEPDIICVAAYGMILPKNVLDIPRYGCINVHASLLPRWRGAAPIQRAILNGDEEAGVCIMRMEEGLDTGDYCVRRSIPIRNMNAEALTDELASLGAQALLTALSHIEQGSAKWVAQSDADATYADKISKNELNISPTLTAVENCRRVQASDAQHPSKCRIGSRDVIIQLARLVDVGAIADHGLAKGVAAFEEGKLFLGCSEGIMEVLALKPVGKASMDAKSFAQGFQALREGHVEWGSIDA